MTHETVDNAQAGISRCWSRHLILQEINPLTPNNRQQNINVQSSFHLAKSYTNHHYHQFQHNFLSDS